MKRGYIYVLFRGKKSLEGEKTDGKFILHKNEKHNIEIKGFGSTGRRREEEIEEEEEEEE